MKISILNLCSGIVGNRTLWDQIPNLEITAVENNNNVADIYHKRFPKDIMVIGDAYEYLEQNMDKFDVIWASPPCQSHTKLIPMNISQNAGKLPDLRLYSIIIYLSRWFKGKYIIENVIPYYEPLITPQIILERHCFWCNFTITKTRIESIKIDQRWKSLDNLPELMRQLSVDPIIFEGIKPNDQNQYLRNSVNPNLGLYLLKEAIKPTQKQLIV